MVCRHNGYVNRHSPLLTTAHVTDVIGTGSISILFHAFPYANDSKTMVVFTYIFFFLNLALFILFNALTAARYILFPDIWSIMLHHPTQSLFLGTYPMGATTLINIAVGLIYEGGFGGQEELEDRYATTSGEH